MRTMSLLYWNWCSSFNCNAIPLSVRNKYNTSYNPLCESDKMSSTKTEVHNASQHQTRGKLSNGYVQRVQNSLKRMDRQTIRQIGFAKISQLNLVSAGFTDYWNSFGQQRPWPDLTDFVPNPTQNGSNPGCRVAGTISETWSMEWDSVQSIIDWVKISCTTRLKNKSFRRCSFQPSS